MGERLDWPLLALNVERRLCAKSSGSLRCWEKGRDREPGNLQKELTLEDDTLISATEP